MMVAISIPKIRRDNQQKFHFSGDTHGAHIASVAKTEYHVFRLTQLFVLFQWLRRKFDVDSKVAP
jgi:hypothetical protein